MTLRTIRAFCDTCGLEIVGDFDPTDGRIYEPEDADLAVDESEIKILCLACFEDREATQEAREGPPEAPEGPQSEPPEGEEG